LPLYNIPPTPATLARGALLAESRSVIVIRH